MEYRRMGNFSRSTNFRGCGRTEKFNLHVKFLTCGTQPVRPSYSTLRPSDILHSFSHSFVSSTVSSFLCTSRWIRQWNSCGFIPLTANIKIAKYSCNTLNHKTTKSFRSQKFPVLQHEKLYKRSKNVIKLMCTVLPNI